MQNYESLNDGGVHEQDEQAILFHTAETTRSKWTHIEDLDSFFSRMYRYHQKHGFTCMLLQDIFDLNKFVFVVILTTYLLHGINYDVLFGYHQSSKNNTKVTLNDVILPLSECIANFTLITWCMITIAFAVTLLRLLSTILQIANFWDIKQFYNTALKVNDDELDNLTWSEVMELIKEVQMEIQMCIHKNELTELDIYHRILRQENYMVAMVNKHLFPPRFNLPLFGEVVYWTKTLRYNIQGLLFWSPWSPFESPWRLRDEYKKLNLRNELANELGRYILWLAFINLCLAPIIFFWQILYSFYSYGELIKRDPGKMGIRSWSPYSKLYFRHFNELDHELKARLTRAYQPANEYLASFSSPVIIVIAQYVGFLSSSLFTVLIALTIYDEDVIAVEHIITLMTVLGGLTAVCRSCIPNETLIFCPEQLLESVVAQTHYLPGDWKGNSHTSYVRKKFQQLFQMSLVAILEDLFAPILTPFLMWKWVYPRSLEIVDFFRNFTVHVVGVGDVCSFAEMNLKKHGNPLWSDQKGGAQDQYNQGEDGKIELSLVHFIATNPSWVPPPDAQEFIESLQEEVDAGPLALASDLAVLEQQGSISTQVRTSEESAPKKKAVMISEPSESDVSDVSPMKRAPVKSVVWFTPIDEDQRAISTSLMTLRDKRKSVARLDGPDLTSSANMARSTVALHSRHARSRMYLNTRSADQYDEQEETTPLLPERRPSQ